jgi:type II secretory pathway component GspD/PulD (secretin)
VRLEKIPLNYTDVAALVTLLGGTMVPAGQENTPRPAAVVNDTPAAGTSGAPAAGRPSPQGPGTGRLGGGLGGGFGGGAVEGLNGRNLVPDGIEAILGYRSDNSLIVRGTSEATAALRRLINLLDVPAKQVRVRLTVGHLTSEGQGTNGGTLQLSDALSNAADGGRLSVAVTPRINGDGSISLDLSGSVTIGGETHPISTQVRDLSGKSVHLLTLGEGDRAIQVMVMATIAPDPVEAASNR